MKNNGLKISELEATVELGNDDLFAFSQYDDTKGGYKTVNVNVQDLRHTVIDRIFKKKGQLRFHAGYPDGYQIDDRFQPYLIDIKFNLSSAEELGFNYEAYELSAWKDSEGRLYNDGGRYRFSVCSAYLSGIWNLLLDKCLMMKSTNGICCYFPQRSLKENLSYVDEYGNVSIPFSLCSDISNRNDLFEVYDNGREIQSVGAQAFQDCYSLTSISLPSVISIGFLAFDSCTSLSSVSLPKVISIGSDTFGYCNSIASVSLPEATLIGEGAFRYCDSLTSVSLPKAKSINKCTFQNCASLSSIYVNNDTLHSIGNGYEEGNWLVVTNDEKTLKVAAPAITHVNNDTITSIGSHAFQSCASLSSISLPEVSSIGEVAFSNCTSLKALILSGVDDVTELWDTNAFENCPHVSVYVKNTEMAKKFPDDLVWKQIYSPQGGRETVEFVSMCAQMQMNTTSGIKCYFNYTDNMVSNFEYVDNQGTVLYPFNLCSETDERNKLAEVDDIYSRIKSVGQYAFISCLSLTSLNLPSLTSFGWGSLFHCTSLSSIYVNNSTLQSIGNGYEEGNWLVVADGGTTLEIAAPSITHASSDTITRIGANAFHYCESLSSVYLPHLTVIGNNGFNNCKSLQSAYLPFTQDVQDYAFRSCTSIESVDIPSCLWIGSFVFQNCSNLTSIHFPNVNHIGAAAFMNCSRLGSISFPCLSSICESMAAYCTSLSSVSIPDATSIGSQAFYRCTSLNTLILSGVDSVTELTDTNAFGACHHVSVYVKNMEMVEEFIADTTWNSIYSKGSTEKGTVEFIAVIPPTPCVYFGANGNNYKTQVTELTGSVNEYEEQTGTQTDVDSGTIVNNADITYLSGGTGCTCTSIGSDAFFRCTSLSSVSLPEVSSIGSYAFSYCTSLSSIYVNNDTLHSIGNGYEEGHWLVVTNDEKTIKAVAVAITHVSNDTVTSIGDGEFYGCTSLSSVSLPEVSSIGSHAFRNCTSLSSVSLPAATSIGTVAFGGCNSLTSVSLPEVSSIGEWIFSDCTSLTSVSLPEVSSIGQYAFRNCTSLSSVSLPEVSSIGSYAFSYCTSLSSVSLPSVTSIGDYAFSWCTSLSSLILSGVDSVTYLDRVYVFTNCPHISVYVKNDEMKAAFEADSTWGSICAEGSTEKGTVEFIAVEKYGSKFLINDEWKKYKEGSLGMSLNVKTQVLSIGQSTADTTLKSCVSKDSQITSIADYSFCACESLTSVSLPSVTSIGKNAFSYCTSLSSVSLPSATWIGEAVFRTCTSLTSISLPFATSIGDYAFSYCSSLSSISLPNATSIGGNAFDSCESLTSVSLPAATSIDGWVFSYCSSLSSISLPNATSIRDGTFWYCTSLTSVSLPSVNSIGSYTFYECTSLNSVTLGNTSQVATLANTNAFYNCPSTYKVYVPSSLLSKYKAATNWSSIADHIYAI